MGLGARLKVREEVFISGNLQALEMSREIVHVEGAEVGVDTITSYGPAYPYKGGSGPAGSGEIVRPHPLTAHVTIGQSGFGTANYRLVGRM